MIIICDVQLQLKSDTKILSTDYFCLYELLFGNNPFVCKEVFNHTMLILSSIDPNARLLLCYEFGHVKGL